jgi:hypothetical protein
MDLVRHGWSGAMDGAKAAALAAEDARYAEEARIARQIVQALIAAGYGCALDDGALPDLRSPSTAMEE